MKTKSLSLSFGLMLAFFLSITFMLAGCSKSLDFDQQLQNAALNYFDNRNSYANFADTTYSSENSITTTYVTKGEDDIISETTATQSILYVKRIGTELALKLNFTTKAITVKEEENAELNSVQAITHTTVTETTYIMAPKIVEEEPHYYIVESKTITVDNGNPTTTAKYYEFDNHDDYQAIIEKYLINPNFKLDKNTKSISGDISSVFNSVSQMRGLLALSGTIEIKEGKNSSSLNIKAKTVQVEDNKATLSNSDSSLKIKKNKLDTINIFNININSEQESKTTALYSIADGADVQIAIDLEGVNSGEENDFSEDMFVAFPRINLWFW